MTQYLPSTRVYSLSDLDVDMHTQIVDFNNALLNGLHPPTLTQIKNAFNAAFIVNQSGQIFVKISLLNRLLRTGSSGADNYMWQHGINGYVSPSKPYELDGDLCIAGADFLSLVEARIYTTAGKANHYLKYVRALYFALNSLTIFHDLRTAFTQNIENLRSQLKRQRIQRYAIISCEFTGIPFQSQSDVEFAHVDSVVTAPNQATNVDNGVIVFSDIHSELTRLNIHNFAGMYEFCVDRGHSTDWADRYYM